MESHSRIVLITGGSGLLGKALTSTLQAAGYRVRWLVRNPSAAALPAGVEAFRWSVTEQHVDPASLTDVFAVVHLAGENVGEGRWTPWRKQRILDSRIKGTEVLSRALDQHGTSVRVVLAASATGFYGPHAPHEIQTESSAAGTDFLAQVTQAWESATARLGQGRRLVQFRIGVVLSRDGGALPKMAKPIRLGAGAALGSGEQMMSWIHIGDLCRMFRFGLEHDTLSGICNAVSPEAVSNKQFTRILARHLHRPLLLPPVPAFVLRLALGEMSTIVLDGCAVSPARIQQSGFDFEFPTTEEAVRDLVD